MPPDLSDFFISYNKADRSAAEWINRTLKEARYTTIIQTQDFVPGSNWVLEMDRATRDSKRTIAVLSPDFLAADYTAPEWAAAFAKDPRGQSRALITIRVRPCDPTGLLGQIVYIDLADFEGSLDQPEPRQRLLDGIRGTPVPASQRPTPKRRSIAVPLATAASIAALTFGIYATRTTDPELYRVRVTVTSPQGIPVEDAKVWSTVGGEPKKVAGGWEFTIPHATRPADGNLTVFATVESAFQKGTATTRLHSDANPTLTIALAPDTSAFISGAVVDVQERPVSGALVAVVGHPETATTDAAGHFRLPAHAAPGQQIQLRADKAGFQVTTAWHPAGSPAELILDPLRP